MYELEMSILFGGEGGTRELNLGAFKTREEGMEHIEPVISALESSLDVTRQEWVFGQYSTLDVVNEQGDGFLFAMTRR